MYSYVGYRMDILRLAEAAKNCLRRNIDTYSTLVLGNTYKVLYSNRM